MPLINPGPLWMFLISKHKRPADMILFLEYIYGVESLWSLLVFSGGADIDPICQNQTSFSTYI